MSKNPIQVRFKSGQDPWRQQWSIAEAALRLGSLTLREHDMLKSVLAGMSCKASARDLGISANTARRHRINLYRKCAVGSAVELIAKLAGDFVFLSA